MINKLSKFVPFSELLGSQVFKSKMGKGGFKNGISDFVSVDRREDLTEDEKIPMRITAVGDMVAGGVMTTANPFGLIIGGGIRTPEAAKEIYKAGADIIIVGNGAEQNRNLIKEIAQMKQYFNLQSGRMTIN